jgi:hypothetical protein
MEISDLEHISPQTKSFAVLPKKTDFLRFLTLTGLGRAYTDATAIAEEDLAVASALAAGFGDWTRTYTSTRSSVKDTRHGSFSYAFSIAYAMARTGTQAEVSLSVEFDSY